MSLGKRPNKDVARLLPYLGEPFDGFVLRGVALVCAPAAEILYGFHFDPRPGHGLSRWMHAFALPLSVPTDHLSLSFGCRVPLGRENRSAPPVDLGTEAELRETARAMETDGASELAKWSTVEAFRRTLSQPRAMFNSHRSEATAVLAAREGDFHAAVVEVSVFETYIHAIDSGDLQAMRVYYDRENVKATPVDDWQWQMLARLRDLRERCVRNDPKAVRALLDGWRAHTIAKLGIEAICLD